MSAEGIHSQYYNHMFDLMKVGSTKTFEVSDNIAYDGKISVRIIGLCQDVKEDDTVAGLTFQATHALKEPMQMQHFKYGNSSWEKSRVRKWLKGTALPALPKDLQDAIANTRKYYSAYTLRRKETVKCSNDKLFILSAREMYNYTSNVHLSYNYDGTGRSHDQQYAFYEYNNTGLRAHRELGNIACQIEVCHNNMTYTYTSWWTRSFFPPASYCGWFHIVGKYGDSDIVYANRYAGVVPAFAF